MINLKNLQPTKISRDLKGYTVFIYGEPKVGKTTTASKFEKNLIFGFEKGYSALPNIYAVPVNTWSEALSYQNQLLQDAKDVQKGKEKDPNSNIETQFATITIDTADLAYEACETYICNQQGIDSINQLPYGQGWKLIRKEFDTFFRRFVNAGYGLVIISHDKIATVTDDNGKDYQKITPTLESTPWKIINRLCDIIGYVKSVSLMDENGKETHQSYLFMRGTSQFIAGSRFKYTPDVIKFSYEDLVKAINDAIDQEGKENNNAITDERVNYESEKLNFDTLHQQTIDLIESLINKNENSYEIIKSIIENRLGAGQLLQNATKKQIEQIYLIYNDLLDYSKSLS